MNHLSAIVLLFSTLSGLMTTYATAESIQMARSPDMTFFTARLIFNKSHPTLMLVDTGASETILTDWFAKDAGIKPVESKEETSDSAGKAFKVFRGKVSSLEIGAWKKSDLNLPIVNIASFKNEDGIAGLFSPQSFFTKEPVLIDFPGAKLAWGKEASSYGGKSLASLSFHDCKPIDREPFILVNINGIEGKFLLDTGGFKSAVTKQFAKKLGDSPRKISARNGISGTRTVESLEKLRVNVGQISGLINADVESQVNGCPIADGKFGIDWLSKYGVFLSADRKTVSFFQ